MLSRQIGIFVLSRNPFQEGRIIAPYYTSKQCVLTWQYASSEFRRYYVPLWVLFRKWGMKGVCLSKRWGKCYRRCIVKFNFLAFIEWISTFYFVYLWVSIWDIIFNEKYSKLRYNLSIPCHFKVELILKEAQKWKRSECFQ